MARIAVGTYLSRSGLPRYTLVDWTEQYDGELDVEGCDGTVHTETGAAPSGSDAASAGAGGDVSGALGGGSARAG